MQIRIVILILIVIGAQNVGACKIKRGFEALSVYNYFDAKRAFEKSLKRDEVAASYGLSVIYFRDDNPFHNLDSARNFIQRATLNFGQLTLKDKLKYDEFNVDSLEIYAHREKVGGALFIRAKERNTVEDFQTFIDRSAWSIHKDSAIYLRDELAYENALEKGKSAYFDAFLKNYPSSSFKVDARANYDRLIYQERTESNEFVDYVAFTRDFPESPYRSDAEDHIFEIATVTGSLEAYKTFIRDYPENRNVSLAWKRLFSTYLQEDYSSASIKHFMNEFTDYPFKEDLEIQLMRSDLLMYPIRYRNKWGYTDESGAYTIPIVYDGAQPFHEGLAIILKDEKYGFIDKTGSIIIEPIFEDAYQMSEGHAVVQYGDLWGMINRSGEFIVDPVYEDVGNLTEGLAYFTKGDTYGYFDRKGKVRLKAQYTDANDFENGKAIVSKNGQFGLIDAFGTTSIPFKYDRLMQYDSIRYLAKLGGLWGLINENGDSLFSFAYEFIGPMKDGWAIVTKDEVFNYINGAGELLLTDWVETYPEYKQLAVFQNGYAKLQLEKGYNLLDTNGRMLLQRSREDVGQYGKYIAVRKSDKWAFLTRTGQQVLGYNYTYAESFEGKFAKAGGAPLIGLINKTGNYVIEPYFEQLNWLNDTLLITKSRGSYGVLTTEGDTLLPFSFVSVEPYSPMVLQLETKESLYYYHLRSHKYIRKEEE